MGDCVANGSILPPAPVSTASIYQSIQTEKDIVVLRNMPEYTCKLLDSQIPRICHLPYLATQVLSDVAPSILQREQTKDFHQTILFPV